MSIKAFTYFPIQFQIDNVVEFQNISIQLHIDNAVEFQNLSIANVPR